MLLTIVNVYTCISLACLVQYISGMLRPVNLRHASSSISLACFVQYISGMSSSTVSLACLVQYISGVLSPVYLRHVLSSNSSLPYVVLLQEQSALLLTQGLGDWVVQHCSNCGTDVCVTHRKKSRAFVCAGLLVSVEGDREEGGQRGGGRGTERGGGDREGGEKVCVAIKSLFGM